MDTEPLPHLLSSSSFSVLVCSENNLVSYLEYPGCWWESEPLSIARVLETPPQPQPPHHRVRGVPTHHGPSGCCLADGAPSLWERRDHDHSNIWFLTQVKMSEPCCIWCHFSLLKMPHKAVTKGEEMEKNTVITHFKSRGFCGSLPSGLRD